MTQSRRGRVSSRSVAALSLAAIVLWISVLSALQQAPAQPSTVPAPDPTDIAAGMRIYRQKADCQACHGWAADGRKTDQMPDGPNLRATRLARAAINAVRLRRSH
jgi:mono/diheme cytochrome c family protein